MQKDGQKPKKRRKRPPAVAKQTFPGDIRQKALPEQVFLFSSALASLKDAVCITDLDHNIIYANRALEFTHGYKPGEVIGKKSVKFFEGIAGNPPNLARLIKKEAKNGFWSGEILSRRKNGTVFPVRFIENTVSGKKGEVLGYIGIFRDISAHQQLLDQLQQEENRFRNITENALEMVWEVDTRGKYTYVSPVAERILGYKPEEMLKKHFYDLFSPEDREKLKRTAFKIFSRRQTFREFINRNIRKDGQTVWLSTSGVPIIDGKDKLVGYRGADIDVTRRWRVEEYLRESELKYKSIFEAVPISVVLIDKRGKILDINPYHLSNIARGKTRRESFIGENILKQPTVVKAGLSEKYRKLLAGEAFSLNDVYFPATPRGPGEYFNVRGVPLVQDGEVVGAVVIHEDITERRKAMEFLKESEEQYRALFEQAADSVLLVDGRTGDLVNFNDRAHENLGYTREEFKKLKISDLEVIESSDEVSHHLRKIVKNGSDQFETKQRTKNGEIRDIVVRTRAISIGGKDFIQAMFRDITEQKQTERRMREASKLEAVGTLSMSIAHEFNNILMGISGYAQLALADWDNRRITRKAFDTILRQSKRGATMVQRLSSLGRREKPDPGPLDLTKVLDEVISLQERELNLANIQVRRNYKQPSLVLADYSQIEQVFFNLVTNARHAIAPKAKGTITLQVEDKGEKVEARVSDNGSGIEKDKLDKIFLPFFTTKTSAQKDQVPSLGLGLWVCQQIVEENGGKIAVESRRGAGTTFLLTFPLLKKGGPVAKTGKTEKDDSSRIKKQRVLIVDDEPELAEIYREYLTGRGLEVTLALSGEEAIQILRNRGFETIILDYIMPGLSGKKLAEKIKNTAPESKIIIISGQPITETDEKELKPFIAEWLSKPVKLSRLDRCFQED